MGRKRRTAEEIVDKLRQEEIVLINGIFDAGGMQAAGVTACHASLG